MPRIPLPKAISVAQFAPPVGEPTYTQIFHETMGNAGTPDDGFDQKFSQMAALTNSVGPNMNFNPTDLEALSSGLGIFGKGDGAALALQYKSASDATDAALADYSGLTTPTSTPTNPVGPPNGAAPTPPAVNPCIFTAADRAKILPPMKLADMPLCIEIDSQFYTVGGDPIDIRVTLECSQGSVFSLQKLIKRTGTGGGGNSYLHTWNLIVTPNAVGTFNASVLDYEISTDLSTYKNFTLTVTPAK